MLLSARNSPKKCTEVETREDLYRGRTRKGPIVKEAIEKASIMKDRNLLAVIDSTSNTVASNTVLESLGKYGKAWESSVHLSKYVLALLSTI